MSPTIISAVFCLTAKDTIQHIFWECKHSQQFWTRLGLTEREVYFLLQIKTECLILFGINDNIKTENVFDFILLLAKQYLYKCKIGKQPPNIDIFRRRKKLYRYKIEEYNAKMSCSCSSFFPGGNLTNLFCRQIMLSSTSLFSVSSFISCL